MQGYGLFSDLESRSAQTSAVVDVASQRSKINWGMALEPIQMIAS